MMSTPSPEKNTACTNTDVARAILTLATPLFAACNDDEGMKRNLVSLAITAWNISLYEATEEKEYKKKVEERLSVGLADHKKKIFTQFVLQIIDTKQKQYPSMLKGITNWDFFIKEGAPVLTVEALPIKPTL